MSIECPAPNYLRCMTRVLKKMKAISLQLLPYPRHAEKIFMNHNITNHNAYFSCIIIPASA
jgi:hypothetical protein